MQQENSQSRNDVSVVGSEEYAGANRLETALGKGKKWGFIGGVIGDAVGALGSAAFIKADSPMALRAQAFTESLPMIGKKISGRAALIVGGALGLGMIGHKIGFYLTALHAWKDADAGREQFERLRSERDAALVRAETAEAGLQTLAKTTESFAQKHPPRIEQGGHTAAHAAASGETVVSR